MIGQDDETRRLAVEEQLEENSTEIRDIQMDSSALPRGSISTGDHIALPSSTGLRLRKTSIHVDTTGNPLPFRYLVIDLSGISFIDMAGVKLFKSLVQDYDRINIHVLFAGAGGEDVLNEQISCSSTDQLTFVSVHFLLIQRLLKTCRM